MNPTPSTIKRLFAVSSNRCAFPKCQTALAIGKTLVGEVCHIKGEKPGAARYYREQSEEDRRAYENLILMCPTHHTVIDDDEDSYTVERLHKLKAEHEAKAIPLSDEEVERVSSIIVHKPFHNVGQTGGLAANTINAGNIQVYGAPNVEPLMRQRQVAAVDTLWKIIKALRDEFSDIVFVDTIYTQEEINDYFARVDGRPISLNLHIYRGRNAFAAKFERAGEPQAEAERPYISHELWQVFFIIRAVHGRMAFLIEKSFGEESYQDWRSDIGIDQQLRAVLPPETVQHLKSLTSHGLQSVFDTLEQYFLVQARMRG